MKSVGGANKIYDAILAQDLGDPHLFLVFPIPMALAVPDWDAWKEQAGRFFRRAHRGVAARESGWEQRLVDFPTRAAYSVATRRQAEADRALGAQPCCRCGEWTHSWCERCEHPSPTPVCSRCDSHKLLCQKCTEAGLPYPEEVDQSGDIVVSGYHDAEGAFISLTPPVRVPQAEIPYTTAGEIDIEALVEKARRRSAEFTPRGSA